MTDNQLIVIIIALINSQKATAGIPDVFVKQAYQPTQQGANKNPTVYLHKVSDKRYGYPKLSSAWNAISETMEQQTTQQYETTFQISGFATQDPSNINQLTASDIINSVSYILQNAITVAILEAQGIGILRISDIRNPLVIDDRERHEYSPNFDFTLTHKQIITTVTPIITKTELDVFQI